MPYDSVYLEKRPPGALRTVWRKFYGDTTAMIGLVRLRGPAPALRLRRLVRPLWHRSAVPWLSVAAAVVVALWRSLLLPGDR